MTKTKTSNAGASSPAAPARAAARLADLHIRDFDFGELTKPPVIVIHAPREAGTTTLITSLLVQAQERLGIDGVVVLCDRPLPDGLYMNGVIPRDVVFGKPADKVLKALIGLQVHRLGMDGAAATELPRLALALDDTLYTPKLLRSEAFQCDVKRAKNYNIMVIIATSNCDTLPKTVHTFATHVLATRCVSAEEPKHLQKRMFVMFPNAPTLVETLALCRRYEFLVGLLCPCDATSNTIVDATRVYVPTLYVGNERLLRDLGTRRTWASSPAATPTPVPVPAEISAFDVDPDGTDESTSDADADTDAEDGKTADAVVDATTDPELVGGPVLKRRRVVTGAYLPLPAVATVAMNRDFVAYLSTEIMRL